MSRQRTLERAALLALVALNVFLLSALVFSRVVLRGETVSVPALGGKTVEEAQADLARKDLALVRGGREFDEAVPRDRILRQDPVAGSRLRVTGSVRVVLSAGTRDVSVPACEGKMLEAAVPLLRDAGLARGKVSQIHTDRWPAGKVIAQKPPAGSPSERSAAVALLVSQGAREDEYIMPDLIERSADEVIPWLKARGFRVGDVRSVYYPGVGGGVIVGQFPLGGYKVQKRNLITLEVSRS